ncbi:macro domain-containing protein [Thermogemmatispora sp.]|uniref:macro domain-containing protein n=1 Tax=Thermogemmatispora sp. TaxID=1968838 RepID=UPI001D9F4222|nr:macro domain-containing protein [Thermogemmatispora sp.]MBX5450831.1 macro domain-containing protein [Thermogemmatispora sp.]
MAAIRYERGDLLQARVQVLVNPVNCKGVMGKGLALTFRQRYPSMFLVYQQQCQTGELRIGKPCLYRESQPWILNFPTKNDWRRPSKLEYIEAGLRYLVKHYQRWGIQSIAFPKLGTQNGKLSWDQVGPLMARYLSQLSIEVWVFIEPGDTEYYAPSQPRSPEAVILEEFNSLAFSRERLEAELHLSHREAGKVARARASAAFTTFAEIEQIEGLAKISLKRIKDYWRRREQALRNQIS